MNFIMFIYVNKKKEKTSVEEKTGDRTSYFKHIFCMHNRKYKFLKISDIYCIISLIEMPCTGNNQWMK